MGARRATPEAGVASRRGEAHGWAEQSLALRQIQRSPRQGVFLCLEQSDGAEIRRRVRPIRRERIGASAASPGGRPEAARKDAAQGWAAQSLALPRRVRPIRPERTGASAASSGARPLGRPEGSGTGMGCFGTPRTVPRSPPQVKPTTARPISMLNLVKVL